MKIDDDTINGTIESLAFGGQGILRQSDRFVWFVPFTAPGDVVSCRVRNKKPRFGYADVLKLHNNNEHRQVPLCTHYTKCSGCQLQHIKYPEQLRYKREIIIDCLQRIGGIKDPQVSSIVACEKPYGYRRHISLNVKKSKDQLIIGYTDRLEKQLMHIDNCCLLNGHSPQLFVKLQQLIETFMLPSETEGRITIFKQIDEGYLLHLKFEKLSLTALKNCELATSGSDPLFSAIHVSTKKQNRFFGKTSTSFECEGMHIQYSTAAFIQNNASQSLQIYYALIDKIQHIKAKKVLDLYCGFGLSSLLMAKRGFNVCGVELNSNAVACAKKNALTAALHNVDFISGDVAQALPLLLAQFKPDAIFLNPPREGLSQEVCQILLESNVAHVFYMSCMPSTLARDAKRLAPRYHLKNVDGYDMFPQTTHVECLAAFEFFI